MDRIQFINYLHDVYEIEEFDLYGMVRTYHTPTKCDSDLMIEDFSTMIRITDVTSENVTWELDLGDLEGTLGSVTSGSRSIKHGEKYKHRHEFVSEAFKLGESDVQLKTISELNDDDDRRTPDYILKDGNVFHVLELTTTKSPLDHVSYSAYEMKMFSYELALKNRANATGRGVTYTIVVVNFNYVLSTIPLPIQLVNELLARFRISLALERHAEMRNIDMEADDYSMHTNKINEELRLMVSNMRFREIPNSNNPINMDPNYLAEILSPTDERAVVHTFVRELSDIKCNLLHEHEKQLEMLNNFISSFADRPERRRSDRKPVTFFPFIITQQSPPSLEIPYIGIGEDPSNPVMSKLWSKVMDFYQIDPHVKEEDPSSLINEALEEDLENVRVFEESRRISRRKYHRVDLKGILTEDDLEHLSLQGLWAKKHKGKDYMEARRIHQQSAFTWETDVSDIQDFLASQLDLESAEVLRDERIDLLSYSNDIMGNDPGFIDVLENWRHTKLFQALEIISDIAYEVAISNKQHCRTKEVILKKLRNYNIYLIISPTKSSEHCFVSLFIPRGQMMYEGVFGRTYEVNGGSLTEFFSIKQSKLENQSSMPASLISLASFWAWFYELPSADPSSFRDNLEAYYMLKFSLLVRLEDKAQTEETITITRYMYMELFKANYALSKPLPFKMLSKLSNFPRSRLNLFCLKKIQENFTQMVITNPQRVLSQDSPLLEEGEDSIPQDAWMNLLNWVSGMPVISASKAINLVYLGYLKNKMESAEGNTDLQLIEKTCEEEFKYNPGESHKSMGFCEARPKEKQFSLNMIKHGCDVMITRLQNMLGDKWMDVVEDDIFSMLTSKMTNEIATLKASSTINHSEVSGQARLSNDTSSHRIKVIEAISERLENFGLNPLLNLERILTEIEDTSKGVVCDLFKKQQHGGLREIYVLTIESRIVQLYVETISRVLCSYFDEETLTHPKNKLKKLDNHRTNTARIASRDNSVYVDFCSSTDKTRWNQNIMMPALAAVLVKLTPPKFHSSIIRVLNLWSNKVIKLPQRVCNLLLNSVDITSSTFKTLLNDFWSASPNHFISQNGGFVRLTSGMMQGILHFSSSLLHLSFLNSMNKIIPALMKDAFPKYSFLITQVCSSDDSATILTAFSPKGERKLTQEMYIVCKKISQVLECLNIMANYFCMKNSLKTTTSIADYVEFNSEFLFKNTIAIPIIKFVAASLNLTEAESYLERFHTMYNLISDLFASGFPSYNTYLCQLAQGLNHYKTMGSSINSTFPFYAEKIKLVPDPILGFFLLDTHFCPGVLGFSFSYWKCASSTGVLRRSKKTLMDCSVETLDSGGIVQSLVIKYGELKRWRKLVNKVCNDIDVESAINGNPEIMFRKPQSLSEVKVQLAIKSTMPSVAKSMRRGNPYLQALAMSVYSINTHCFSKTSITKDIYGKVVRMPKKTSLLLEIMNRLNEERPEKVSETELNLVFPSASRYEEAQSIIDEFSRYNLVRCPAFRMRRTEVTVQPFTSVVPLSLQQCCLHKWYGYKVHTSETIAKRCFNAYQSILPWLGEDIKSTLELSPFSTYQELANFITSQIVRTRLFVRVGPGVYSKRFTGQLYQLIKKSYKDKHVFKASADHLGKYKREHVSISEIVSKVSLLLMLPKSARRDDAIKRTLVTSPTMYGSDINNITKLTKREASFSYIQGFLRGDLTSEDITTHMQETGTGCIYSYTQTQERVVSPSGAVKWLGRGQCFVTTEQLLLIVNMRDDIVTSVEVSNWSRLQPRPSVLVSILNELKLRVDLSQPSRPFGRLVARFNGKHWTLNRGKGVPILENKYLERRLREVSRLSVSFKGDSLSLDQDTDRGKASVVRFKTYPGDVLQNFRMEQDKNPISAWQNQKSFDEVKAAAMILFVSGDSSPSSLKMKEWIIDTLSSRLSQKGLTRGPGLSFSIIHYVEPSEQIENLEVDDETLNKLHEELLQDNTLLDLISDEVSRVQATEEQFRELPIEYIEETAFCDWAMVLHNWYETEIEENVDITSRNVKSFKYLHPFWDAFISAMSKEDSRFWENVFKGHVSTKNPEISESIIKLLGVKATPSPASIENRAKLQILEVSSCLQSALGEETQPSWYDEVMAEEQMSGQLGFTPQQEKYDPMEGTSSMHVNLEEQIIHSRSKRKIEEEKKRREREKQEQFRKEQLERMLSADKKITLEEEDDDDDDFYG